ncbi:flagellar hook-basal body complex protein FliE [Paenibacillus sp. MY03]|jgi:flagellar hook-basal body complex protein FliE|uniref:flagellar hook-basal body complex protein FliE n=1 Tax=Paenibacillus TaxID=44249 RepID=UPI000B3C9161|nr:MULTISPECIES: flagellar hook-basal body complex protein FliE [Paenibacillus]OUS71604.1 flagellar hook-basal body complex protein FliE [Paenibacillus sp. MY03]
MIQSMQLGPIAPSQAIAGAKPVKEATPAELTQSFGQYLQTALESVSNQEKQVHALNDQFLAGKVDVTQVLIASEQAQLGLQLTSQVRNKVVEAYQEMMRMQL